MSLALEDPRDSSALTDDPSGSKYIPTNKSGLSLVEQDLPTFLEQPFEEQRKSVDAKWLELAYVLPSRAVHFALRATKKEFSALQALVTSAAIAKDKRFPNNDESFTIKLPATMLSAYSVSIQLTPTTPPPIDITPKPSA